MFEDPLNIHLADLTSPELKSKKQLDQMWLTLVEEWGWMVSFDAFQVAPNSRVWVNDPIWTKHWHVGVVQWDNSPTFTTLEGGFPWTSHHGSAQSMHQSTANRIVLVSIIPTCPFRGNLDGIHPISRYTQKTNKQQIFYTPFTPLKSTVHTFRFFGLLFHSTTKNPLPKKSTKQDEN